ncbi:MAG TPA: hypothetical protein VME20_05740, partial [Acidimicrobiales bacterium]|nr:hypothetical protein [Acidimicrobiales bacterium]
GPAPTVWVGSDGEAACFGARSAKLGSIGIPEPDLVTGDVVVTSQGTFGVDNWAGGGIVKIQAPPGCGASR